MGHRANYAVVEGGRVELFRSQWGALGIIRDVFFGPGPAVDACRAASPVDEFMFDYWCEGAMLVDLDAKRLAFFGGNMKPIPELIAQLVPMVATNWPGWEVRWAHQGIVDLVLQLGLDPDAVHDPTMPDSYFDPPELKPAPGYSVSLITMFDGNSLVDHAFEDNALSVLSLGPTILEVLRERAPFPIEQVEELEGVVYIDTVRQEIRIGFLYDQEDMRVDRLRRHWPGWTILRHYDGLPGHYRLAGRDPAPILMSRDEIFRQITESIFEANPFNPTKFLEKLEKDGEAVEYVHPDFLKMPQVALDEATKRSIFARTLTTIRERTE